MVGMYAVIFLLVVLAFSVVIIRTGTIALTMTNLSTDIASFQAVSAFTGVGFTTQEAEDAISTPDRRRIVKVLILLGNVGIITGIATLVLSFTGERGSDAVRFTYLVVGGSAILLFARSRWFDRLVTPIIVWGLGRTTSLDTQGYRQLLQLRDGYRVAEIHVSESHCFANKTLQEVDQDTDAIVALGIIRSDGSFRGTLDGDETIPPGDTLLVYGRHHRLQMLSECES